MATPDRILLLSQLYPPDVGGSAVLLHEGYSRLVDADLTVAADAGAHRAGRTSSGAPLVPLPIATPRWGFVDPRAVAHHLMLAARLRRLAGSRTVVHCARALPEGIAAWAARWCGGPRYICWSHGEDVATALLSRELTMVMNAVHRGASALIANSRNTKRLLEGTGVPSTKIHVIYPGVDAGRFSPAAEGARIRQRLVSGDGPLLLSVGRLQRRKGHDLAIKAVASLCARWPNLRYVIIGDGEERGRLTDLCREHGVLDRVVFAGEVSPDELPRYYAACDIFVLPNREERGDIEGFGIVFLEAAASGRPTIGGRSGGVPEAVADGLTGRLVSGTDAGELADAIDGLARDPGRARRMGRAGRERVLQSFTWESTAERILSVHLAVAGRGQ